MAAIVNINDKYLENGHARVLSSALVLLLTSTATSFHINTSGVNDIPQITFNATQFGIPSSAIVSFSASGGTLTSVTALSAVLTYANMSASPCVATASCVYNGVTYSQQVTVTKVFDGAQGINGTSGTNGTNGARGPGQFYASGTAWSDTVANSAVSAPKQVGDVVTISGTGFAQTKKWDGTNWNIVSGTIDPTLLLAASLDATKFANTIEPVTLVTTVPTSKSTNTVFNTNDGKLYRWNGTAYVSTIAVGDVPNLDATKITSGQFGSTQITDRAISTAKLATGAVTANEIAANTILAKNLVLFNADSVNPDSGYYDPTFWTGNSAQTTWPANTSIGSGDAYPISRVLLFTPGANIGWVTNKFQIEKGQAYRVKVAIFKNAGTNGGFSVVLNNPSVLYDPMNIPRNTTNSTGYNLNIDFSDAAISPGSWHIYEKTIIAGSSYDWLQFIHAGTITGGALYVGLQLTRAASANLIVDGSITSSKLTTDSVIAGQIAAGAISAREIQSGAITTSKLVVTPAGGALNADPNCVDPSAWTNGGGNVFAAVSDGAVGNNVIRSNAAPQFGLISTAGFPISGGKTYRVTCKIRASGGTKTAYLRAYRYNAGGTLIASNIGYENAAVPNGPGWTQWSATFAAESTAVATSVQLFLNWSGTNDGNYVEAQDVRFEEVLPGTLIQDGAITTQKIQVGSITADRFQSGIGSANLVPNSGLLSNNFGVGNMPDGWIFNSGNTGSYGGVNLYADRTPAGTYCLQNLATGSGGTNAEDFIVNTFPCIPGAIYEASVWAAGLNCNQYMLAVWYNSAGTYLGANDSTVTAAGQVVSGEANGYQQSGSEQGLGTYKRIFCLFQAPANATQVRLYLRKSTPTGGQSNAFWCQPYFGFALSANQTKPSQYAPTGNSTIITGGLIKTGTITADKITVSQLSVLSPRVGTLKDNATCESSLETYRYELWFSNIQC
jgi:hypothetical protein